MQYEYSQNSMRERNKACEDGDKASGLQSFRAQVTYCLTDREKNKIKIPISKNGGDNKRVKKSELELELE